MNFSLTRKPNCYNSTVMHKMHRLSYFVKGETAKLSLEM
jgi:hypothetical protein